MKRILKKLTEFRWHQFGLAATGALLLASPSLLAGGLVFNGAGLVEQNAYFAYEALPGAIDSCLSVGSACISDGPGVAALTSIRQIAIQHPAGPERILFISEKAQHGYFDTDLGQAHRIAKTGFTPNDPIYFNVDQFYLADGKPAMDLPALAAILVHELGHQAGIQDHQYLDNLGGRIRLLMKTGYVEARYPGEPGTDLRLTWVNFGGDVPHAELYFWDGEKATRLTRYLRDGASCIGLDSLPVGWNIDGWHREASVNWQDPRPSMPVTFWLDVRCLQGDAVGEEFPAVSLRVRLRKMDGRLRFETVETGH